MRSWCRVEDFYGLAWRLGVLVAHPVGLAGAGMFWDRGEWDVLWWLAFFSSTFFFSLLFLSSPLPLVWEIGSNTCLMIALVAFPLFHWLSLCCWFLDKHTITIHADGMNGCFDAECVAC